MQKQVLGPIKYLDKKCYIISQENYKHSSDKILGKLNCVRRYYLISNETFKLYINDQQQSTSDLQCMQTQVFGPINYQNKEIYALSSSIKVKDRVMGYVYIDDVYYAISEEAYGEYLLKNDQKIKQQLQQFMQQLVRPINYNNTEFYGISKENYEYILEIIPAIKKTKLVVNEVYYIISKKRYDKYLNMQNEQIRKLLQKIVSEKLYKGMESYLVSEDNYNHFVTKIQDLNKGKEVRHEKYYKMNEETYNLLQNMINGQQIPEQQDELSFMQQEVIGHLNYFNKDCYIIDKENYEYFFKLSNQQPEGQVKIKEEYNVISKEIYDDILQQITSGKLQHMQRQILGPVNCLNGETYIIGEAYGKGLSDEQIIRKIKINKEYYIIDKKAYDKIYNHLRFQQFVERLNAKLINHNNTEVYGINKESYKYIISERIPKELKEQVISNNISVQEDYYAIKKDVYTSYFQNDQQIQNFMGLVNELDKSKGYYLICKENYNKFFRNIIINNKEFRPTRIKEEYIGINKEVYDKYILKIDRQKDPTPEQQVELILQNFTQRQVLGRLNFLGEECYVIDKENYTNFLNQAQANKQVVIEQVVRPIRINVDYYIIIKKAYESRLGPVDTNSCNSTRRNESEELMNDILSRNQALEEECKKLRIQNQVFENECGNLKSQNQAFENECGNLKSQNQAFENEYENLKSQNQVLKLQNGEYKKRCEDLGDKITELREEVTKYQSELGDATSFHLGNQDSNSTSQLSDDIRKLHEKLVSFCNVKREVKINNRELKELMKKYDCLPTNEISKNLISGVLERAVIETIIEKTEAYFNLTKNSNATDKQQLDLEAENNENQQPYLEAEIFNTTDKLLTMTELFTKIRVGTDRVSEAIPTKLRQQVYAILGNRGFSQTFKDVNDSKEHQFIVKLRDYISNLMNRYREFKNPERLKKSTEEINKIIREVINIFFFRLNVQQPIATWDWLPKGTMINTLRMEASWDENETDDLRFDICAFPLIGSNINQSNEKVIVPAQVVMNTLDE
ncbi:hypothetical protein GLOIN_2v1702277 [Rhizophagus irregularis DAOM 181602=DAOM 197198]|nr:hypothetical protein GLOIN_2v1702277 [Rhizophagus irregularis DAOM 181602=DAOM 197198]